MQIIGEWLGDFRKSRSSLKNGALASLGGTSLAVLVTGRFTLSDFCHRIPPSYTWVLHYSILSDLPYTLRL